MLEFLRNKYCKSSRSRGFGVSLSNMQLLHHAAAREITFLPSGHRCDYRRKKKTTNSQGKVENIPSTQPRYGRCRRCSTRSSTRIRREGGPKPRAGDQGLTCSSTPTAITLTAASAVQGKANISDPTLTTQKEVVLDSGCSAAFALLHDWLLLLDPLTF